ncbi:hypothetical protein [Kushneria phosphatilytica]|uniref:Uncharacterized protein n=1 Tax=Kushneria phosphatilytica TaxID=657387 RepID=A0A1S1NWY3_9GAMM|nr:hypothetical protein [Kushneria phosphatilytica]OHV11937.1 hypothetical protein BH688_04475 [Kushneria phosphatilytica]QEL11119.1 hypothetical protein FY550_08220 [Kushneria phosphatilytica]
MSDDSYRNPRAIVPGQDDHLTSHDSESSRHGRQRMSMTRRRPLWPLYFLILLLALALSGSVYLYWQDRQSLHAQLSQQSSTRTGLGKQLDQLSQQVEQQRQQLSNLAAAQQSQPEVDPGQLKQLQQAGAQRDKTLHALQQSQQSLDKSISQLHDLMEGRQQGTQDQLGDLQNGISQLSSAANSRDQRLDALNQRMAQQQSTIDQLDQLPSQLAKLSDRVSQLEDHVQKQDRQLGDLKQRQTSLEATQASIQGLINSGDAQ